MKNARRFSQHWDQTYLAAPGRSRQPPGDRDRAKAHRSGFGVRNFNTWDLAQSFESADPRYQLAVVVAAPKTALAELLRRLRRRHSPLRLYSGQAWAAGTSASQLVEQAYRLSSVLWDDPDVVEFAHPGIAGAW